MNAGIILAAGKGTRFAADNQNKVTVSFHGLSPIQRAVNTMQQVVDDVYVVVGHESESVKHELAQFNVTYVVQEEQLGTGHALKVALEDMETDQYEDAMVGNGDHMMFYTPEALSYVLKHHDEEEAVVTAITSHHDDVSDFGFGRIVRDDRGTFLKIVEQKSATDEELKITEFYSGFGIYDMSFAVEAVQELSDDNPAGEFLITDLYEIAVAKDLKIEAVSLPFEEVGIGINSREDYQRALELFEKRSQT